MAISDETTTKKTTKTVHLNNSEKYYRKLDNTTLRTKIPGEENVTAKDIWLDALSCDDDWLFTTKNIAARWGIALKTAEKKMTLLSKCGLAIPEKITDPKTNKIMLHIWQFFEKPHPPKQGGVAPYDGTVRNKKKKLKKKEKAIPPQTGGYGTYIENKQHNKNKQQSAPSAKKDYSNYPKLDPIKQKLAIADGIKKIRAKLPEYVSKNLSRTFLTNAIIKYSLKYLLILAELCIDEPNPQLYFTKGIHKKGGYEKINKIIGRQGESKAIEENKKHTEDLNGAIEVLKNPILKSIDDNLIQQSLTQPSSVQNPPNNPKKNMAYKERKEIFLSNIDPSLYEYYLQMSDYELQNRSEFKRHTY